MTLDTIVLSCLLVIGYIPMRYLSKRAREQQNLLEQNQALLKATLHSIADGVITTDPRGLVTGLNAVAEQLTGWSATEAQSRPVEDVLPIYESTSLETLINPIHRALAETTTVCVESPTVLAARDGSVRQLAISCTPIRCRSEEILGAVLIFRDVSEDFKQKELLRTSQERFLQLAQLSGEVIWEVDTEGLYTYVSEACREVWGYEVNELVNRCHFYDIHPEETRDEFRRSVSASIELKEQFTNLKNPVLAKNGKILTVLTNAIPLISANGQLLGYRGSDRDITTLIELEKELALERSLIENIIESTPVPIYYKDIHGKYLGCNIAFLELLGKPKQEILGKTVFDIAPSTQAGIYYTQDRLLLNAGTKQVYEEDVHCTDDKVRRIVFHKAPFYSGEGRVAGLVGAMLDITERNENAKQLRDALLKSQVLSENLQAEKLRTQNLLAKTETGSVVKSTFLAKMSSEIRDPLNGIIGLSSALLESNLDSEQQKNLCLLRQCADSLLHIVNDIIEFTHVGSGDLAMLSSPFQISEIFNQVCEQFTCALQENQLEFSLHIEDNVPSSVVGDKLRLGQIIHNVLDNAVKFTPAKGSIAVLVELGQEKQPPDNEFELHIAVSDTGVGVAADRKQHIFEPFVKLDCGSSTASRGTGLGLSVCRELVQKMGGRLWIESPSQPGTTFHFTVILGNNDHRAAKIDKPKNPAKTHEISNSYRILLVEDNKVNQLVAQRILEKNGHQVVTLGNGREAVELLSQTVSGNSFDLILMDCEMPIMNGYEATRRIRKLENSAHQQIPIIALTAHVTLADSRRALESGMNDYLPKPYNKEELLAKIESQMNLRNT